MSVRLFYLCLFTLTTLGFAYGEGEVAPKLWSEGVDAYKKNDWELAVKKWSALNRVRKEHPGTHYNLGCAYFQLKKFKEARDAFERGRAIKSDSALQFKLLFNLGRVNSDESELLRESKPLLALERLKSAIVNFRQSLAIDRANKDAAHNLEMLMKRYQQQWKQSQKARDEKKASENREEQSKELEKLKREQEEQAKKNKESEGKAQQESAKKKQEELSKRTQKQLDKMSQQADSQNQAARQSLQRAREAQKAAEEALSKGEKQEAAEKQREAAKALADAAEQMKNAQRDKQPKEANEPSLAQQAKDALNQEKKNKKRRAQRLRQLKRQGIKPVEKDW